MCLLKVVTCLLSLCRNDRHKTSSGFCGRRYFYTDFKFWGNLSGKHVGENGKLKQYTHCLTKWMGQKGSKMWQNHYQVTTWWLKGDQKQKENDLLYPLASRLIWWHIHAIDVQAQRETKGSFIHERLWQACLSPFPSLKISDSCTCMPFFTCKGVFSTCLCRAENAHLPQPPLTWKPSFNDLINVGLNNLQSCSTSDRVRQGLAAKP